MSKGTDAIQDAKIAGSFIKRASVISATIALCVAVIVLSVSLFIQTAKPSQHRIFVDTDYIPFKESVNKHIEIDEADSRLIREMLVRIEERTKAIDRRLTRIEDRQINGKVDQND